MSYTQGTVAALVDAVVPETPELRDRGEEHAPGALAAGVDETVVEAFDNLQPVQEGPLAALGYDATPLSTLVALLLDFAALELLVRGDNERPRQSPDDEFAGGPFSRLAPRDRLRAVRLLEGQGALGTLEERLGDRVPALGVVQYLAAATVVVTELAYYSEWGDDGDPQGWQQAGYPGPADGYAVSMGHEVEEFEENDYR